MIVVQTPDGVTVSFPPTFMLETAPMANADTYSARPGYFVVRNNHTRRGQAGTVLVEPGGTLNATGSDGRIKVIGPYFVRRRGTADVDPRQVVVYAEPGAILSATTERRSQVFTVPRITVSDAGLFVYAASPSAPNRNVTSEQPQIADIQPHEVCPGNIITVRGTGLLRTTRVDFVDAYGRLRRPQPGFRVMSDTELRVEVPDDRTSLNNLVGGGTASMVPTHVIVATPTSATVTAISEEMESIEQATGKTLRNRIAWVKPGGIFSGNAVMIVVEPGGVVLQSARASLMLVRSGGRSDAKPATHGLVFAESQALLHLPDKEVYTGGEWIETRVREVSVSFVDFQFCIADALRLSE